MYKARHARPARWPVRMGVVGAAVLAVGGLGTGVGFAVASSGHSGATAGTHTAAGPVGTSTAHPGPTTTVDAPAASAQLASAVVITPAGGATGVAPNTPVRVTTSSGTIQSVSVTSDGHPTVVGGLSDAGRTWTSMTGLAGGATYSVSATVVGAGGVTSTSSSSFATLTPTKTVTDTLEPDANAVVGVGQPIVVKFNHPISDPAAQAAVLAHFTVTESEVVPGGWHWFTPTELHFRPEAFWPAGDKVTVSSDLDGWAADTGYWGSGTNSVSFTIGDSHVSIANLKTDQMIVTDNGQVVQTFPISAGSSEWPTQDGIHIAMDKEPVVHMVSSTVGIPQGSPNYYNEYVYNDVHISDSGEYVHAAPWSEGEQGRENVSHGCINLSSTNSKTFYDFSQVGDVVEVVDGTRPPVAGDHGVMDWDTDWSQWAPGVVIAAPPAPAPSTPGGQARA